MEDINRTYMKCDGEQSQYQEEGHANEFVLADHYSLFDIFTDFERQVNQYKSAKQRFNGPFFVQLQQNHDASNRHKDLIDIGNLKKHTSLNSKINTITIKSVRINSTGSEQDVITVTLTGENARMGFDIGNAQGPYCFPIVGYKKYESTHKVYNGDTVAATIKFTYDVDANKIS